MIALAVIERVEEGRIAARLRGTALRGAAPAAFELKRSPLRPPPLRPGDRALLLLRGARAPYVLVDEPDELALVASDAEEASWREALPALLAAGEDLAAVAEVYARWVSAGPGPLREAAEWSFVDLLRARPELSRGPADYALDPRRAPDVRRSFAAIATLAPAGTQRLVERLAKDAPLDDAEVLQIALRASHSWRTPEAAALARRVRAAQAQ